MTSRQPPLPDLPPQQPPQQSPQQPPQHAFMWPVRVYWEDTDAGGIVFYANYLKFFERARTEWLRSLGLQQQALREQHGGFFVVTHTQLRYLHSARLDDCLQVSAEVTQAGRASLQLRQQAWAAAAGSRAPRLLCMGDIRIGWVDAQSLKPQRMPGALWGTLQTTLPSTTIATAPPDPVSDNATP